MQLILMSRLLLKAFKGLCLRETPRDQLFPFAHFKEFAHLILTILSVQLFLEPKGVLSLSTGGGAVPLRRSGQVLVTVQL